MEDVNEFEEFLNDGGDYQVDHKILRKMIDAGFLYNGVNSRPDYEDVYEYLKTHKFAECTIECDSITSILGFVPQDLEIRKLKKWFSDTLSFGSFGRPDEAEYDKGTGWFRLWWD